MTTWALWLACAGAPAPISEGALPPDFEQVELIVGDPPDQAVFSAAQAWAEPDGVAGQATDATVRLPGEEPLVLTGQRTTWDLRGGKAVFEGNVIGQRGEVTLRCDRLEATLAGDRVVRAVAAGHLRVERGGRVATGDEAVLLPAEGRVELTGHARVEDGTNVLTGDRLVLYLDDDRLTCDQCRVELALQAPPAP